MLVNSSGSKSRGGSRESKVWVFVDTRGNHWENWWSLLVIEMVLRRVNGVIMDQWTSVRITKGFGSGDREQSKTRILIDIIVAIPSFEG